MYIDYSMIPNECLYYIQLNIYLNFIVHQARIFIGKAVW